MLCGLANASLAYLDLRSSFVLLRCLVSRNTLTKILVIGLPNPRRFFIIKERQKCVATTACDARYIVEQRAWKNDGAAGRRFETPRAVFGEAHFAPFEFRVQVNR